MKISSLDDKNYIVIVNDFARYTLVVFLVQKDNAMKAFSKLCKFI